MVVLKKIRGATLIEVLTASVLIVIVFMFASLSFNTIFSNQIQRDHSAIQNRVKELEYLTIHSMITLPFAEDFDGWEIVITGTNNEVLLTYSRNSEEYEKVIMR